MPDNEKDSGIARSRSKEKNNQKDAGAASAKAGKRLGPLAHPSGNPKSGGKISRAAMK